MKTKTRSKSRAGKGAALNAKPQELYLWIHEDVYGFQIKFPRIRVKRTETQGEVPSPGREGREMIR